MFDLIKAIRDRLADRDLGMNYYTFTAPTEATLPYVVITPRESLGQQYNTGKHYPETVPVQFSVFSDSATISLNAVKEIEKMMSYPDFNLYTEHMGTYKVSDGIYEDPDKYQGRVVYHGLIILEFLIQSRKA